MTETTDRGPEFERIWANSKAGNVWTPTEASKSHYRGGWTEYVRADLPARPTLQGKEKEVVEELLACADHLDTRDWNTSSAVCVRAASLIETLAGERDILRDTVKAVERNCDDETARAERAEEEMAESSRRFTQNIALMRERTEAAERHVKILQEKASGDGCACGHDSPDDVCVHHSPMLVAAQARVKELGAERDEARGIVREIHWMARRYAHGRRTYAPSTFNSAIEKALRGGWITLPQNGEPIYADDGDAPDALSASTPAAGDGE